MAIIRFYKDTDQIILRDMLKYFNTNLNLKNEFEKYLIIEDGEILGFLSYLKLYDKIEINYIYIAENYRRLGYASQLLNYLLNHEEYNDITLEVRSKNENAISLYEKNGFKRVAVRSNYYSGEDGYLMHKKR